MVDGLWIFDCDGVLVDSEIIAIEVEGNLLREAGFDISNDEIAERFVGLSYPDMMTIINEEHGRPVPEGLRNQIQELAVEAFPTRLQPVEGIAELLKQSSSPRCVASSSKSDKIKLSLGITELDRFFDPEHLFSTQLVEFGKPAPDIFIYAAKQMGFDPQDCVVLEDSAHGVTGAVAAGITTIGFVGGQHARPSLAQRLLDAGASKVIEHPLELLDL